MAAEGHPTGTATGTATGIALVSVEPSAPPSYQSLDDHKQLEPDASIAAKFSELEQAVSAKKFALIAQSSHVSTVQRHDMLNKLSNLLRDVSMLSFGTFGHGQLIQQQQPQMHPHPKRPVRVLSDTWNSSVKGPRIVFNPKTNIAYTSPGGKDKAWHNCFGSHIVHKGQKKTWKVRIVPSTGYGSSSG